MAYDESALAGSWIVSRLRGSSNLTALLGTCGANPSIAQQALPENATFPGIVVDLNGGANDVIVPQGVVWANQIWGIRVYTYNPADFSDLLYYVQQALFRQRGAYLTGRIVDCWRNRVLPAPAALANDQMLYSRMAEYTVIVAIP